MEQIVKNRGEIKRIKTYINGLDENMQGGVPAGHITLISGSAGTMKSSICFNILYFEALEGKTSLYVSLEQGHASLINHMINMGYDFSKVNLVVIKDLSRIAEDIQRVKSFRGGSIIIADIGCIRKEIKDINVDDNRSWLNVIKNLAKKIKSEVNLELFVLDSMKALYMLSKFKNPRIELFYIFEFLRDADMTTFLISEISSGEVTKYGEYDEDFLADGIIHIRLTPFRRNIVREISIVKMRTTECNNDVFSLDFKNGQFSAQYGGQNPLL
ncbi:MAG: ATPase domain-containing protein [Nanoarchaeota archaeon]